MTRMSVFDFLQASDNPEIKNLQQWIAAVYPKANDRASFLLAIQLEKLFEMAVFENQIDTVHLLLQQGIPPDMRGDWGTTPLMWASCLNYSQIISLLQSYGADQSLKSFSGHTAHDFQTSVCRDSVDYQSILDRRTEIHAQVKAGYLKPVGVSSSGGSSQRTPKHRVRQINNGKGIDEALKKKQSRHSSLPQNQLEL